MRLRVVDYDDGRGPHIIDTDTGELLEGVVSFQLSAKVDEVSLLKIQLLNQEVDFVIEGTVHEVTPRNTERGTSAQSDRQSDT
jgi:hypothetical protein